MWVMNRRTVSRRSGRHEGKEERKRNPRFLRSPNAPMGFPPIPLLRFAPLHAYLEFRLLGIIISAVGYGVVLVLSGNCVFLLQRKRDTGYTNCMQLFPVCLCDGDASPQHAIHYLVGSGNYATDSNTTLPRQSELHSSRRLVPTHASTCDMGADGFMVKYSDSSSSRIRDLRTMRLWDMTLCGLGSGRF